MGKMITLLAATFLFSGSYGQKMETVYLNGRDSTTSMYIAVTPEDRAVDSFLFLLDGFGNSPQSVLVQSEIPQYASQQGVMTFIPLLKTGALYFGSDAASQESLKEMVERVVAKYKLQGKKFYIGGFSIGGTCAMKYAELAVQHNYPVKPDAVFAVDPPLDWERYYEAAQRIVRLSKPKQVNSEVTYMIERIYKEMNGSPATARENFYDQSPYSYSDPSQRAVKNLVKTPLMIISEPDIQWWLSQRRYDYSYINITDHAAMINELQRLGNNKAVLVTTANKGYRKPGNNRHPHSWSIADAQHIVEWLQSHQ